MPSQKNVLFRCVKLVLKDSCHSFSLYPLALLFDVLASVLAPLSLAFIAPVTVAFASHEWPSVPSFVGTIVALIFAAGIFSYLSSFLSIVLEQYGTIVRVDRGIMRLADAAFSCDFKLIDTDSDSLFVNAFEAVDGNWVGYERILKEIPGFLSSFVGVVLYSVFAALVSGYLFLLMAGLLVLYLVLSLVVDKHNERIEKTVLTPLQRKKAYYSRIAKDPVAGKDIRNNGLVEYVMEKGKEASLQASKVYTKVRFLSSLPTVVSAFFLAGASVLSYFFLVEDYQAGRITISELAFLVSAVISFVGNVSSLSSGFNMILFSSQILRPFLEFLDKGQTKNGGIKEISRLSRPWSIRFENVTFSYDGKRNILQDFSLTIKPGEKIALVGENGAGKTTIAGLLCQFLVPQKGRILVDDVDIKDMDPQEYRKHLAVINQKAELFPYSLAFNIAGKDDYDKERMDKAIKESDLLPIVQSLPKGLMTNMTTAYDPNGTGLSGGQVQKVLLARCLYREGDLLLLDEPTAALDPLAEATLYNRYQEITSGKTSLFISHRLASTRFCDRILFLKDGKILEEGTHESLLAKNGEYAHMFQVQAKSYQEEKEEE